MEAFGLISIVIGTVTYFAMVVTFLQITVRRRKIRREDSKNRFYKVLQEGLKSSAIIDMDDVVNVYKGASGLSSEDLDYRYGLSNHLREFLVKVIAKEKSVADGSLEDETIRDWKQKITNFISQNEASSPYADLPSAERNVLNDISTFLENNDQESVKRKTSELAGMIQARHNDLASIRNINRWTVPLAIIGLVFTVIFGILALIG